MGKRPKSPNDTISPDAITEGWEMAGGPALDCDKYTLLEAYYEWAIALPNEIDNPTAHFFDYCRKRKRALA